MRAKGLVTLLLACVASSPVSAQGSDAGDGLRVGLSVGGISMVNVTLELFRDSHSVEFALGTWSFRDLSVSAVYKEYIGGRALRPFLGAGFWVVAAAPVMEEERTGFALVLRAPVGVDWAFVDDHAAGAALNFNRGLLVRRSDPEDDLPMSRRIVPLPELYYRYTP